MEHRNLVKALEKLGLKVENVNDKFNQPKTSRFRCQNGTKVCIWLTRDGLGEYIHSTCVIPTEYENGLASKNSKFFESIKGTVLELMKITEGE